MDKNNNIIKPGSGKLLIASPEITDPTFARSVVFLLESELTKGDIGLILNHPLPIKIGDLMEDWDKGGDWPMFNGGPVDVSRLFLLHTVGATLQGSHEIAPGIFVGGNVKDVGQYMLNHHPDEEKIRYFLGYSGWEAGQLQAEIDAGDWVVADVSKADELLRGEGSRYWRNRVLELGEEYRHWSVMPEAPQIN